MGTHYSHNSSTKENRREDYTSDKEFKKISHGKSFQLEVAYLSRSVDEVGFTLEDIKVFQNVIDKMRLKENYTKKSIQITYSGSVIGMCSDFQQKYWKLKVMSKTNTSLKLYIISNC